MRNRKWYNWCNEEVLCNNDYIKRKEVILELARDGLIPFVKSYGYEIECTPHRLAECIARSLYFGKTSHEALNDDYRQEDYEHYYFTLDDDVWDAFWSRWEWSDVDENSASKKEGIRFCVWTLLDLYKSSRTAEVDEMLGLTEEENVQVDTRDPYLVDSANGYFSAI